MDRGVTLGTRHRRHREVRFFFSWLSRMGHIKKLPFARIKSLRQAEGNVQPFTYQDITRLLCASFLSPFLAGRNRAIVLLLLDTGIRLNELVCLDTQDLECYNQRLRVLQGQGNKQRMVWIGDRALEGLNQYINENRGEEPDALLLSGGATTSAATRSGGCSEGWGAGRGCHG